MIVKQDVIKEEVAQWIDQNEEFLIQFVQELIYIPSENPPGHTYDIAEFIERRLKEFGFGNTQLLKVDEADAKAVGIEQAQNILTVQNFGAANKPEIILNAYGDTVPPGVGWTYDPYDAEIKDGKIYGRGAAIAKSDIAVYTYAILALKKIASKELNGRLRLAVTFDGESGGFVGPRWLLRHKYIEPDMAITPGFTHSILNAHNGCIQLKVSLIGKGAHASVQEDGSDALEAMTEVLNALYTYRKSLKEKCSSVRGIKSPTLTIGLIEGGTSTNVVPDQCSIYLDRRFIPEENGETVEQELRRIIEEASESFTGIDVQIERKLLIPTFGPTAEDTNLIQTLGENWKYVFPDKELKIGGIPLYADARHYSELGIPTVMFGAGPKSIQEANGYQADEHIEIRDLVYATKIIALTLYDLLIDDK